MDFSNLVATTYDNGLFPSLAEYLGSHFKRSNYFSPWEKRDPKSDDLWVGKGVPGITRINNIFEVINNTNLFVFPDVHAGITQNYLRSIGKRVWGSGKGEELEVDRIKSKEILKSVGLKVPPYTVVRGIQALRKHLQTHKNVFVKGLYRGDFESFFCKNYELIKPRVDEIEHTVGEKKATYQFIVEEKIENTVEIAYDGPCIDGDFPDHAMWGVEKKDKWYIGKFEEYSKMPKQIKMINFKLSEALRKYKYRNFLAIEAQTTKDGMVYVTDPCCRFASPPGEGYPLMYKNLPDILWHGAEGKIVDPIPGGKYLFVLLITSSWVEDNCQAIEYPLTIHDHVKLANMTIIDGKYYVLPRSHDDHVGCIAVVGNTIKEVVSKANKYAEQLEGYEIRYGNTDDVEEELKKLKSFGFDLGS